MGSKWVNTHFWFLGGLIGLMISVVIVAVAERCNPGIYICKFRDEVILAVGQEYYIGYALLAFFAVGAFIGWIIGMFKEI